MAEEKEQFVAADQIALKNIILKLREWYRYLLSKWLIIVIVAIAGAALGFIYSMVKKPQYTATLTFALEERVSGGQLGDSAGIAGQFGINLVGGGTNSAFSADNITDLIMSRLMITKSLSSGITVKGKEQSLADYYIDFNHFRRYWMRSNKYLIQTSYPVNFNTDSLTYRQDSLMGNFYQQILKDNLTVAKLNRNSGIISVTCKSSNELFAKYFTEALVKNVSAFYIQTKTKQATANVNVLRSRLDSVRQKFNTALYGAAIATDENINSIRAVAGVERIKNQTSAQIMGAEYGELVKNLEIAKMTLLQETPLIQVIDKPILPLKREKLTKLKGLSYGGFLAGLVIMLVIIFRKIFLDMLK